MVPRIEDLTPYERNQVQEVLVRRYVQLHVRRPGRRRGDLPLPAVARHLSESQIDRLAKWCAAHWTR